MGGTAVNRPHGHSPIVKTIHQKNKSPHQKRWRLLKHNHTGKIKLKTGNHLGKISVAINLSSQTPRAMANANAVNVK